MFISITRLHLRHYGKLPAFFWHAFRSRAQAGQAPGLQQVSMYAEKLRTFWTLTAWDGEAEMRAYRNDGAHVAAMRRAADLADGLDSCHYESDTIPDWPEARRRLLALKSGPMD